MAWTSILMPSVPEVSDELRAKVRDDKWTISNERVFMEDLVYKRMSLFLTLAGALLAGAITLREQPTESALLLVFGTGLCWVFQQTIDRAQIKLDVILAILFKDDNHPTGYINTIVGDRGRVRWVGYLVPKAVCLSLSGLTLFRIVQCWNGYAVH